MLLKAEDAREADNLDATRARDRWTWVSMARSLAASSLEQRRAGIRPGFFLTLPHQEPDDPES